MPPQQPGEEDGMCVHIYCAHMYDISIQHTHTWVRLEIIPLSHVPCRLVAIGMCASPIDVQEWRQ